jgi:hypothetical protein
MKNIFQGALIPDSSLLPFDFCLLPFAFLPTDHPSIANKRHSAQDCAFLVKQSGKGPGVKSR